MPNWCNTTIRFHGNREDIEALHSNIEEWTSKELKPSGFGNEWLGNCLAGAGLFDLVDHDGGIICRGKVTYCSYIINRNGESVLSIDTETAWVPMVRMWEAIIKKMGYDSIRFTYMSEECGNELYEIYDPLNEDWCGDDYYIAIDCKDHNGENFEYYDTHDVQNTIEVLQELTGVQTDDIDALLRIINRWETSGNEYCHVYQYDRLQELYEPYPTLLDKILKEIGWAKKEFNGGEYAKLILGAM